jgi:hypothetical protein
LISAHGGNRLPTIDNWDTLKLYELDKFRLFRQLYKLTDTYLFLIIFDTLYSYFIIMGIDFQLIYLFGHIILYSIELVDMYMYQIFKIHYISSVILIF